MYEQSQLGKPDNPSRRHQSPLAQRSGLDILFSKLRSGDPLI
jgi:hypothetical protein